jgi:hypothetical protein
MDWKLTPRAHHDVGVLHSRRADKTQICAVLSLQSHWLSTESAKIPKVCKATATIPGRIQESPYSRIAVKELHPTFGAEISGIDFSQPVDDETFREVLEAISKVGHFFTTSGGRITNLSSMAFASFIRRSSAIKHT